MLTHIATLLLFGIGALSVAGSGARVALRTRRARRAQDTRLASIARDLAQDLTAD